MTRRTPNQPRLAESRPARTLLLLVLAVVAGLIAGCSGSTDKGSASRAAPGEPPLRAGVPDPTSVDVPLWEAGTRGSDPLSRFKDTPYNNDGAEAPTVVASPGTEGVRSIRFELPGGGKRTELEPEVDRYEDGDEAFFGFGWYLPPDFPTDPEGWQVLAQWKNTGDGSPPLEVTVENGQFVLSGGAEKDDPFSQPLGPARTGTQTDLVLGVRFSDDPDKAEVDVWMNGAQVLRGFRPPAGTLYEGQDSYLKTGIYRDDSIDQDAVLFLNDLRIARDRSSAAALAGTGTS